MAQRAAYTTCLTTCPIHGSAGGEIAEGGGARLVYICGHRFARYADLCQCVAGENALIMEGAKNVLVGGLPAAHVFSKLSNGGMVLTGHPKVNVGGDSFSVPQFAFDGTDEENRRLLLRFYEAAQPVRADRHDKWVKKVKEELAKARPPGGPSK